MDSLQTIIKGNSDQEPYPTFAKVDFTMMTEEVRNYVSTNLPNVKNIVLCGMETHVCILQTCYDLLDEGYNVYLCVDGTSSRAPIDRKVALTQLQQSGVFLTTTESVAFQLIGSKSNPHFKAISSLVKSKELPKCLD